MLTSFAVSQSSQHIWTGCETGLEINFANNAKNAKIASVFGVQGGFAKLDAGWSGDQPYRGFATLLVFRKDLCLSQGFHVFCNVRKRFNGYR